MTKISLSVERYQPDGLPVLLDLTDNSILTDNSKALVYEHINTY